MALYDHEQLLPRNNSMASTAAVTVGVQGFEPGPGVRFAKAKGSQGQGTRPPKGSPLSRNKAKVPKAL